MDVDLRTDLGLDGSFCPRVLPWPLCSLIEVFVASLYKFQVFQHMEVKTQESRSS